MDFVSSVSSLKYDFQIFYSLLFYISFSFSRDIIFKTSFNIILKKYFCHKFSFFNGFAQTPLTAKICKILLTMLPYIAFAVLKVLLIKSKIPTKGKYFFNQWDLYTLITGMLLHIPCLKVWNLVSFDHCCFLSLVNDCKVKVVKCQ